MTYMNQQTKLYPRNLGPQQLYRYYLNKRADEQSSRFIYNGLNYLRNDLL